MALRDTLRPLLGAALGLGLAGALLLPMLVRPGGPAGARRQGWWRRAGLVALGAAASAGPALLH